MAFGFLSLAKPVETGRPSDSLSEISESGTTISGWTTKWDSKEDLRDLVAKLGLADVSELHQERFRVDREKLEKMLTGDNDSLFPADIFFTKVMEETDTIITWPNKLKIGAKSKKDPHVKIAGRVEDVSYAKKRILAVLNTMNNRVTMKMDVSYTHHSHIIGKGGMSIKRVMEETKCHVHFPDSNRSSANEKSNQVSISGDIDGVEQARSRVRSLIPLIFGFELPIMAQNVDYKSHYITKIQEQYNVQVTFKTRPKLHATLVLVKGNEWEANEVKNATTLLMDFFCENLAMQTPVQMSMEISPHHHSIVLAKNHTNLKAIMQYTNCKILFPDIQDPNIPTIKKSNIHISGNIHNVYKASQLLMGSLPLIIIFDLPDDFVEVGIKAVPITQIQTKCDVVINIRQKANKITKTCVIKGIERHAGNLYKARSLVLGIEGCFPEANIPQSYHMPNMSNQTTDFLTTTTPTTNVGPFSPLLSPIIPPAWCCSSPTQQMPFVAMAQQPHFFCNMIQQQSNNNSSGYYSSNIEHLGNMDTSKENCSTPSMGTLSTISTSPDSPKHPLSIHKNVLYSSSHSQNIHNHLSKEYSSLLVEMNQAGKYHGPSVDRRMECSLYEEQFNTDSKKIEATRAMQAKPSPNNVRVPNTSWSGYGFSYTSPGGQLLESQDYDHEKSKSFKNCQSQSYDASMNTSNLLDDTPSYICETLSSIRCKDFKDIGSLLAAIRLEHYIPLFNQNEIDISIFSTLTDRDLVNIGIKAFGARRKMLLSISELNRRNSPFRAAPGAERRTSLTNSESHEKTANNLYW